MLTLPPRFVYLTVLAIIAVLVTFAVSPGWAAQEAPAPDRVASASLDPGSPGAPGPVAWAQDPPPYPPPYPTPIPGVAPCCLPPTGDGGFQSAGGVFVPTLLLAISGGGILAVGALARLATARRRN